MIEIRQEALKTIDEHLKHYPTGGALLNADRPFSSLTNQKSQFVREISEIREKVLEAEMRIERRKRGFTRFATWIIK